MAIIIFFFLGVFDVLAYTDKDVAVPFTWIESDAKLIQNPQMVKLHSFDTKVIKQSTILIRVNSVIYFSPKLLTTCLCSKLNSLSLYMK